MRLVQLYTNSINVQGILCAFPISYVVPMGTIINYWYFLLRAWDIELGKELWIYFWICRRLEWFFLATDIWHWRAKNWNWIENMLHQCSYIRFCILKCLTSISIDNLIPHSLVIIYDFKFTINLQLCAIYTNWTLSELH